MVSPRPTFAGNRLRFATTNGMPRAKRKPRTSAWQALAALNFSTRHSGVFVHSNGMSVTTRHTATEQQAQTGIVAIRFPVVAYEVALLPQCRRRYGQHHLPHSPHVYCIIERCSLFIFPPSSPPSRFMPTTPNVVDGILYLHNAIIENAQRLFTFQYSPHCLHTLCLFTVIFHFHGRLSPSTPASAAVQVRHQNLPTGCAKRRCYRYRRHFLLLPPPDSSEYCYIECHAQRKTLPPLPSL